MIFVCIISLFNVIFFVIYFRIQTQSRIHLVMIAINGSVLGGPKMMQIKQVLPHPLMPRPLKPHPVVLTHPVPQEHLKMPKFWQNFDATLAFTKNTPWKNGKNLTMKIILILSNIWLQQQAQAKTTIIYWKQQFFCSVCLGGYLQQYTLRKSMCMSYFMDLYITVLIS